MEQLAESARFGGGSRAERFTETGAKPKPYDLVDASDTPRIPSGIGEFDRVLGGGIVPGSMVLIGGEPGIGKSTLLLQVAHLLGRTGGAVLYVSGEESERQIKLRGERLGIAGGGLFLMGRPTRADARRSTARPPPVVDRADGLLVEVSVGAGDDQPGTRVATQLLFVAKQRGITTFLIGHVTKDGTAGPKSLEHIVDTVLYFEGEKQQNHRIVRGEESLRCRAEMGVFEMTGEGLRRWRTVRVLPAKGAGLAVVATIEGLRPMLVEIQALVADVFGTPRRMAIGIDSNRMNLPWPRSAWARVAVGRLVSVVGGIDIPETATDLGVAAAPAARTERCRRARWFTGLAGSPGISQAGLRIKEAAQMGFTRCIMPARNVPMRIWAFNSWASARWRRPCATSSWRFQPPMPDLRCRRDAGSTARCVRLPLFKNGWTAAKMG